MSKTLGQILFETEVERDIVVGFHRTWETWPYKSDTEAAAEAVVQAWAAEPLKDEWLLERKVIEAARREVEKWKRGESVVPVSIVDAVEALDKAEEE